MTNKETYGSHYNIDCPHCGKINHNVCDGIKVDFSVVKSFQKPCFHCHEMIHYHARWEISVTAYQKDIIKQLRER